MAKAMGPFRYSQAPSWLPGPRAMYRLNPPLIGPDHAIFFHLTTISQVLIRIAVMRYLTCQGHWCE